MTASGADATVYVRLVERMQRYMFTYGYEYIYGVYLTQKQTLLCYRHRLLYGNSDYLWDSVVYLYKKDSFLVIVSRTQYILFSHYSG